MKKEFWWIGERCSRARTTIIVKAKSRKEAQAKLNENKGESVGTEYYDIGKPKVVGRDR